MKSAARIAAALALFGMAGQLVACGGDPFRARWTENPDTAVLFSLARPEINLSSGFDFVGRQSIQVQRPGATGSWDLVLDTQDGELVFLTPGVLGIQSDARIARLESRTFEEVEEAPSDTAAFEGREPVPVETGSVYVVRTRLSRTAFRLCNFFSKLEPVSVDRETGSVSFVFDGNPFCDDRRLVPPDG